MCHIFEGWWPHLALGSPVGQPCFKSLEGCVHYFDSFMSAQLCFSFTHTDTPSQKKLIQHKIYWNCENICYAVEKLAN